MPFQTPLKEFIIRWVGPRRMILERRLDYLSHRTGKVYRVPKGFDTDLASVPRALSWAAADWRRSARPGVLHDWAYRTGAHAIGDLRPISRASADLLFRDALIEEGVPAWRAWLMWLGVRVGGWKYFRKRRPVAKRLTRRKRGV